MVLVLVMVVLVMMMVVGTVVVVMLVVVMVVVVVIVASCSHTKLVAKSWPICLSPNIRQPCQLIAVCRLSGYCFTSLSANCTSRQKEARSGYYALVLFRMTSRVPHSAQYHRQHCTIHVFEQFGALYMQNHGNNYPDRNSNLVTPSYKPQSIQMGHRGRWCWW